MNKLVIIGNGFDLAHGLKTGYNDFMCWYFLEMFNKFFDESGYEDQLIRIDNNAQFLPKKPEFKDFNLRDYYGFLKKFNRNEGDYMYCTITFKSIFLERLLNQFNLQNWVDLEVEYFYFLVELSERTKTEEILQLNKDFEMLRKHIEFYFKNHVNLPEIQIDKIFEIIFSPITPIDFQINESIYAERKFILNFNYTPTFEKYIDSLSGMGALETIYIHGKIGDEMNPILIGYGINNSKEYQIIEQNRTYETFQFIKTFQYTLRNTYSKLVEILNEKEYQVCIMGHSCGGSDSAILKEIFEHSNCDSILIYHNGKTDYLNKCIEISKYLTPKESLLKKIIPFEKCQPLN